MFTISVATWATTKKNIRSLGKYLGALGYWTPFKFFPNWKLDISFMKWKSKLVMIAGNHNVDLSNTVIKQGHEKLILLFSNHS